MKLKKINNFNKNKIFDILFLQFKIMIILVTGGFK